MDNDLKFVIFLVVTLTGVPLVMAASFSYSEYASDMRRWRQAVREAHSRVVLAIHMPAPTESARELEAKLEAVKALQPDPPGWMFWARRQEMKL